MWDTLQQQFNQLSTRYDMSHAGNELMIIIGVSFLLGFLFCFVQSKSKN